MAIFCALDLDLDLARVARSIHIRLIAPSGPTLAGIRLGALSNELLDRIQEVIWAEGASAGTTR